MHLINANALRDAWRQAGDARNVRDAQFRKALTDAATGAKDFGPYAAGCFR